MSTTTYGSKVNSVYRAYLTTTVTHTDSTTTVVISAGLNIPNSGYKSSRAFTTTLTATGQSSASGSISSATYKGVLTKEIISKTYTYSRTTVAQTITIKAVLKGSSESTTSSTTQTITVPALASYTISYNANGGSGSVSSQTKYYGKNITLASGGFSRTNYTLLGWSTSASATTPTYALGASYGNNASVTLYAIWKINYIKPAFGNVIVQRTDANSTTENDEGTAIYVNVPYTEGHTGDTSYDPTIVVTIDGSTVYTGTVTSGTYSAWFTGYDINNAYSVTIQLYDSQDSTGVSVTRSVSSASFPMDILADGSAMGLMHVAVAEQPLTLPDGVVIDGQFTSTTIVLDLPLTSQFEEHSKGTAPKLYVSGNVVTLRGAVRPTSNIEGSSTLYPICTIPEAYRPKNCYIAVPCWGSGRDKWLLRIVTDGTVNFERYHVVDSYKTCTTGYWLPFNVTWII